MPGNYRPITLLNHDAKLGPKILAFRLRKILPRFLHSDQFGFVHGRSIRYALLQFQDLQAYCRSCGHVDAGAILLDFAKAFDSVLWPALDLVLQHFGFGRTFRRLIRTFYHGTLVTVFVNGTASRYFELGCGVRQGDPLSPALFVLFLEPMLNYLRATTGHLGIQLPDDPIRQHVLAFADDCTGLLEDLNHAPTFLAHVEHYASAVGLRLNVEKTQTRPFQHCAADLRVRLFSARLSVVPDKGSTRLLGIAQSPTLPPFTRFDRLLPAMVARCQLWRYRARTLRGRAVILRTIVLPLLWYTVAVTPLPASVAAQVLNLCKSFLFKRPISSASTVRGSMPEEWLSWPISNGGLGLPSIPTFAR